MAIWQLLKGSGYGGYGEISDLTARHTVGTLDPIECAGQAKLSAMRSSAFRLGIPFIARFLGIVLDYDEFLRNLKPSFTDNGRKLRFTNKKYRDQLEDLCNFSITKRVTADSLRFCSTYFSVPKDELKDRAIFNGKRLSEQFGTPESVNIPDIPRLIAEVKRAKRWKGGDYSGGRPTTLVSPDAKDERSFRYMLIHSPPAAQRAGC